MKNLLPRLLATITKNPRQLVRHGIDFEWSSTIWTHNVFRCYEIVFGRKYGIKAELSSIAWKENGEDRVLYEAHSWEASVVLLEQYIRSVIGSFSYVPIRIYLPSFVHGSGVPFSGSPFLLAIAYDNHSAGVATTSTITVSHAVSGSNTMLFSCAATNGDGDVATGITYAGNAMSQVNKFSYFGATEYEYIYYKYGVSGTNNVVYSKSGGSSNNTLRSSSYSGVNQSAPEANSTSTASGSPATLTHSTVAANAWMLSFACNVDANWAVSAGCTARGSAFVFQIFDSGGPLASGSNSFILTFAGVRKWGSINVSFAPNTSSLVTEFSLNRTPIRGVMRGVMRA